MAEPKPDTTRSVHSGPAKERHINSYIVLNDRPCIINCISGSNPVAIIATDIMNGAKQHVSYAAEAKVDIPDIDTISYYVTAIRPDGYLILEGTTEAASARSDVKLPNNKTGEGIHDLLKEKKHAVLTIVTAMGEEAVFWREVQ